MKKLLFIALALLVVACEKPILDTEDIPSEKEANVILHMAQFEQTAFTRAATDITELCLRLNIAIFDADGTKVKTVAQKGHLLLHTVVISRYARMRFKRYRKALWRKDPFSPQGSCRTSSGKSRR